MLEDRGERILPMDFLHVRGQLRAAGVGDGNLSLTVPLSKTSNREIAKGELSLKAQFSLILMPLCLRRK